MTPKRPKELKWIGKTYGDGRPVEYINDVEPRDYSEEETAQLTQDQLASARRSGLYREVAQPEPKAPAKKASPPNAKKAAPAEVVTVDTSHEPATEDTGETAPVSDAAEPATEGEGS